MNIFLDANVLFSASNTQSSLCLFLHYLRLRATLLTSFYVENEAARNIARKRPQWEKGYAELMQHVALVADSMLEEPVHLSEKDRPVLGAAVAARCHYLLTGDKRDFGHLYGKIVGGVEIVSYSMLAQRIDSGH